jgi:hypothetical protein
MQAKKKTVAIVEPDAGNVDASLQKYILTQYAKKHGIDIDVMYGERAPLAGAAGGIDHRNVINDVASGGVGLLLVVQDVRHAVPEELFKECEKAGVTVKFIDVQQERGLMQTP